jgi:hypothetical protein
MPELPARKKGFLILLPSARAFYQSTRAIVSAALAGVSWFGLTPSLAATPHNTPDPTDPQLIKTGRQRKRPSFLLKLGNAQNIRFALQHRSHSSHASHRSHASHVSHYSGTGSSAPSYAVTPQPVATPLPVAPAPMPTSPPRVVASPAVSTIMTIKRVNRSMRTISGQTSNGQLVLFHYRDYTEVEAGGSAVRVENIASGQVPFRVGQRVTITWTTGTDKKTRIATKIAGPAW